MSTSARYRRAVAIDYQKDRMGAPAVSMKADQMRADEITKIARRFGIPVVEDASLARSLSALEIDEQIPEELFEAVAVVLSELDRKLK